MGETNQSETIGQYRIEGCIAEGNLARLCRAVDRTSGQRVMVRIVDPLACRNDLVRASLEALRDPRHPRRAQDPHFLQILDAGLRADSYYIVKEYFESLPLDQHLAREDPSLQEKLRLARLTLECLRAVHGHRIVHGDVKPQNLLVGQDRNGRTQVKIAMSDLATSAAHGMIAIGEELLATPKYLSPEQARGRQATDASDLFALGVVFYEMFTGREPFPADSPLAYLHSNTHSPLVPADRANPQVPAALAGVLARLLARETADRYRHAQSVLDDLDRVESAMNGVTPPPVAPGTDSAFAPASPEHARPDNFWKPIAIVSLTALCLLLVGGIILLSVQVLRGARRAEEAAKWGPARSTVTDKYAQGAVEIVPGTTLPIAQAVEADMLKESLAGLLASVESLVKAGKYDDALNAFNRFTADPKNAPLVPSLHEVPASILLLKGTSLAASDPAAALGLFQKITREYPDSGAARKAAGPAAALLVAMAAAEDQAGRPARSVELLEQARKEYPGTDGASRAAALLPPAQWKLAQSLLVTEPDRAAKIMESLLDAKLPEAEMTLLKQALSQTLLKRVERAISDKRYSDAVNDLRVLREVGRTDPATRGKVLAKEPEALAGLALQLKDQGRKTEAIAVWNDLKGRYPNAYVLQERAAEMAPLLVVENASTLLDEAKASMQEGDTAAALPKLEKLLRDFAAAPEAAEAAELLATQQFAEAMQMMVSGNRADAAALMQRIAAIYPRTKSAAQASALLGHIADAPKGMAYVPAGEFIMGLTPERLADAVRRFNMPSFMVRSWSAMQMPAHRVKLKGFYIDEREVTQAEYAAYVKAAGVPPPAGLPAEGEAVAADFGQTPVTGVSQQEAAAYAAWAGKRLPTEEEWEKAARGADGRLFPWGDEFDAKHCVTALSGADGPEPVGMCPTGISPYGVLDMVGNVAEWTSSNFTAYPGNREIPAAADESLKVVRGAAWDELREFCAVTVRKGAAPAKRSASIGFRCVKDVK